MLTIVAVADHCAYQEPGLQALRAAGASIALKSPFIDPFAELESSNYTNIALVYAGAALHACGASQRLAGPGNSELSTHASVVRAASAGNLLASDRVRRGRRGLFAGAAFEALVLLMS